MTPDQFAAVERFRTVRASTPEPVEVTVGGEVLYVAGSVQPKTAQAEWDDETILIVAEGSSPPRKPPPPVTTAPGWKDDHGKPRLDLIPPEVIFALGEVLDFGGRKYGARNWEAGMNWGRCFGAAMRHLWAWWRGDKADPETGMSHLAHALCCVAFLVAYEARGAGKDDRP